MKIVPVILFILIVALEGCTDKNKVPSGILPPPKMEKVLWDMIQADKFALLYIGRDSALDTQKETLALYGKIFALHKVTKEEFTKSYNFYISRPDLTKVMFDSLSAMANRKREEMHKVDMEEDKEQVQ